MSFRSISFQVASRASVLYQMPPHAVLNNRALKLASVEAQTTEMPAELMVIPVGPGVRRIFSGWRRRYG